MNNKSIVNLTNKIAITFIVILVYWVFIFSMVTIFDFKIFRKNMTEAFMLSILGIIAILIGATVINVMLNLTRIADQAESSDKSSSFPWKWLMIVIFSFPLIFGLLYYGDYATKKQKEQHLVNAAKSLIAEKQSIIDHITNYHFTHAYFEQSKESLRLLRKTDKNFPHMAILVVDAIDDQPVILSVDKYYRSYEKDRKTLQSLHKLDFVVSTTAKERAFILDMLNKKTTDIRYEAHKGNYKLYYPVSTDKGTVVIVLSDYQRYGKLGS